MGQTLRPLFSWRSAISDSDLSPTHRHVAIALSLYANERGTSCWPGPNRLAHDTGLHVSTVKEKLAELEATGWITCVKRGGGRGRANEYALTAAKGSPTATVSDEASAADGKDGRNKQSSSPRKGSPTATPSLKNSQEPTGPLLEAPSLDGNGAVPHGTRAAQTASRTRAGRALQETKRRTTPEAQAVAADIWESMDPRPILAGGYLAFRGLIDAALKAGWDADEIRAVAPDIESWASWSLNRALRQRRRRRGPGGYNPDAG